MKISLYVLLICNVLIASQEVACAEMVKIATYQFTPYLQGATLGQWQAESNITLKSLDMHRHKDMDCREETSIKDSHALATIMHFSKFLTKNPPTPLGRRERVRLGFSSLAAASLLYYSVSSLWSSNAMSYKRIIGCGSIGLLLGYEVFSYIKNRLSYFTLSQKYAHQLTFNSNTNTMSLYGHKDLLLNVRELLSNIENIYREISNLEKATDSATDLSSLFGNICNFTNFSYLYASRRGKLLYKQPKIPK